MHTNIPRIRQIIQTFIAILKKDNIKKYVFLNYKTNGDFLIPVFLYKHNRLRKEVPPWAKLLQGFANFYEGDSP